MSNERKPVNWRRVGIIIVKLALTLGLLWWACRGVEFSNIHHLQIDWLIAAISMAGISVLCHAFRWWCFLRAQEVPVGVGRALELTLIGNLFNLVSIGGIGGDAARMLLLMRDFRDRKLAIAMSVLGDHLSGLVSLSLLFFAVSGWRFDAIAHPSVLGKELIHFSWIAFGGGMILLTLLFVLTYPPINRRLHANGREWKWEFMRQVPDACDVYRRKWRHTLAGIAASCLMMLTHATSFWCASRAIGSTAPAGAVISAMPVVEAISALPVSVSGIGVRENLFKTLLNDLAGVSESDAVKTSLIGFACGALWAIAGGVMLLKQGRGKLKIEA